jgi:hypothetical protein
MPEINRRWIYPTISASENKGIERIALSGEGTAHEVVGVDGSRRFGCRPSSGFRLAHTLDIYKDFTSSGSRPYSSAVPPTQAKTSTVTDCYPVHFQIREGEFGHGFVYRVKVAGGTNSAIYMDYVPTNTVDAATGWRTVLISDHAGGNHISSDDKMDVVSMGRYVFVFVKGRATRVFYVDYKDLTSDGVDNPTYQHKVVNGGPGKRPLVDGGAQSSLNFTTTGSAQGRDHSAYPYAVGSALQGKLKEFGGTDPGGSTLDLHQFSPGDYTFAYYLNDSITGRRSAITEIVSKEEGGSEVTDNDYIGWVLEIDPSLYDEIYIFRSVKMQSVGGTYSGSILHLDTIYDIADLTEVSTTNTAYTGSPGNALSLYEVYYQLSDIALAMQDVYLDKTECDDEMPFAGAAVAFENSLLVSDPLNGSSGIRTSLDSRERNIGELRWSSLTERSPELFPINNKYSPDVYQNRITRLCRAGDYAVGFSADRIYHIRRNGIYLKIEEIHSGFGLASENGFAMAGPMVYFVTTKGIKAIANNGQLDDVKALDNLIMDDWYNNISDLRLSFDPYASCLFVHNPFKEQTVCMWFSTGRVTELHDTCFDDLRTGIFPKTFTRNAYDDTTPTPTTSTSMVERTFFLQNHPSTTADNISSDWKPRVYLLDVDRDKKQVNSTDISVGQNVLRTLDCKGDSVFTVASIADNATNKEINLKSGTTGTKELGGGGTGAKDLVGAYAYVMSATDSTIVGKKFQIFSGTTGTVSTDGSGGGNGKIKVNENQPNPVPPTLAAGDVISISPVLFRYVGGALPMIRTADNQVISSFDLFQNKQVSSVGCHFSDVSGGVTGYKYFRGLVYNATSDSASVSAFPLDFSGTIIGDSIKEGESDDYAAFTATGLTTKGRHGIQDSALNPGIEVFCPDLDYKLMALICRGRTTGTDTTERNSS